MPGMGHRENVARLAQLAVVAACQGHHLNRLVAGFLRLHWRSLPGLDGRGLATWAGHGQMPSAVATQACGASVMNADTVAVGLVPPWV